MTLSIDCRILWLAICYSINQSNTSALHTWPKDYCNTLLLLRPCKCNSKHTANLDTFFAKYSLCLQKHMSIISWRAAAAASWWECAGLGVCAASWWLPAGVWAAQDHSLPLSPSHPGLVGKNYFLTKMRKHFTWCILGFITDEECIMYNKWKVNSNLPHYWKFYQGNCQLFQFMLKLFRNKCNLQPDTYPPPRLPRQKPWQCLTWQWQHSGTQSNQWWSA